MGVIIDIDMDMPKSCETCKFSSYHDGDEYCDLYKLIHGYAWRAKDVKWDDDCPLRSTVDAIPKTDYENRLKADMVAMLTEIQLEIGKLKSYESADGQDLAMLSDIGILFQQKINSLKEESKETDI